LTSSEFSSVHEKGINPLDKTLDINWSLPATTQRISSKADLTAMDFELALGNNLLPTYTVRKANE
jgi:dTDP-4-dehydrorhamnose 3,5-epimerase-like enzyme